jgi:O-antigen ligase
MGKTGLLFLGLFLGAIVAAVSIDIAWSIYFYQLLYFLNPHVRWWFEGLPSIRYSYSIGVVIIFVYIINHKKYNSKLNNFVQLKWLLLMLLMMFALSFYAVWPAVHVRYLGYKLNLIIVLCISFLAIDTKIKFDRMIWVYLIGCFYISVVAYLTGRTGGGRLEGIGVSDGVNANGTAAVLCTAIPLLLYYALNGKNWIKILSFVFLVFVVNALVLFSSRGAFLAVVVSVAYNFFFLMLLKGEKIERKILLVLVLFVSFAGFFYLADDLFLARISSLREGTEAQGGGRIVFWMKTFDLLKDYPFGVGVSGYQFLSPTFLPEEVLTEGMRAVHSTYFQALSEFGYPGAFLILCLLVSNFKLSRKLKKYAREGQNLEAERYLLALESSLIAFLVAGLFIDRLHAEALYWLMLFIASYGQVHFPKLYKLPTSKL